MTRAKMNSERTRKDTRATTTNIPFLAFRISPRRVEGRFTPAFEDAAVEVFVDNPAGDVGSQGAVLILEAFFIAEQKLLEVVFEEPVEGGASGSARSISWLGSRLVRLDRAGGGSHRMIRIGIEMIGGL